MNGWNPGAAGRTQDRGELRMSHLSARQFAACIAVSAGLSQAASAAEILVADAKSQPESLTVAPGGVLIVGSASTPFVYKVRSGSTTAEKFVDASGEGAGTFFFGENSTCNDFAIGPDKALYITDTANAKIYKLPAGASTTELFLEDGALRGIDGITFLARTLYVNTVISNKLYRIPVDAAGKAAQPVELQLDQPVKGPDGMRAANGKLLLAENGSGKISIITVDGDRASVTVIREGLKTPTAVEPAGDTIWIAERGAGKAVSIPMPK
jgi:sugar lactone lactonase YvrE